MRIWMQPKETVQNPDELLVPDPTVKNGVQRPLSRSCGGRKTRIRTISYCK
ncbi:unnamed protein product, partial [Nesidiocoris tenuis]